MTKFRERLIGQDKDGKFTKEALQEQTRRVLAGESKIKVAYPKKES